MKSRYQHLKDQALALRRSGLSIKAVHKQLGVPTSTLQYWFRPIQLSVEQLTQLAQNKADGWALARLHAAQAHRRLKAERIKAAEVSARDTLDRLPLTTEVFELAFAMLYLGEGAKTGRTALGNSDPKVLKFFVKMLIHIYKVPRESIKCYLHLRADQDVYTLKKYWSKQLNLPVQNFMSATIDKRTQGKATYDSYKGVCLVDCGRIAIQRKVVYLYNLFCEQFESLNTGD